MLGTALGAGNLGVNKSDSLCPQGAYILVVVLGCVDSQYTYNK